MKVKAILPIVAWVALFIWWIHFMVVFVEQWTSEDNAYSYQVAMNIKDKCKDPQYVRDNGQHTNCANAQLWLSTPFGWMDAIVMPIWLLGCWMMITACSTPRINDVSRADHPSRRGWVMAAMACISALVMMRVHFGYLRQILQLTWDEQWHHFDNLMECLSWFNLFRTSGVLHLAMTMAFVFAIQQPERCLAAAFTLANVLWFMFKRYPMHEVQTAIKNHREENQAKREQLAQHTYGTEKIPSYHDTEQHISVQGVNLWSRLPANGTAEFVKPA